MSTRTRRSSEPGPSSLHDHIDRWVEATIISRDEAEAIERFETEHPGRPATTPLVVEALAYLGGALALAAATVVLSRTTWAAGVWEAALGAGATICFVSGWLLRRSEEPAIGRLVDVLWGVAVALAGWCAGLVAYDLFDLRGRPLGVICGAVATAFGLVLYAQRRRMIQQLAVFVGLLITVEQLVLSQLSHSLITVVLGAGWVVLGWRELVVPRRPALWFGSAAAMIGGMIAPDPIGLALGLIVAVLLIAASVILREPVMLALGVLGLFESLIRTIWHYFHGSTAMPIALVVAGGVVFAAALVLARRTRRTDGT